MKANLLRFWNDAVLTLRLYNTGIWQVKIKASKNVFGLDPNFIVVLILPKYPLITSKNINTGHDTRETVDR